MKKKKDFNINQSRLYKVTSPQMLADILQVDIDLFNNLDDFISYTTYEKEEKDKIREITYPNDELKKIQKKIFQFLQQVKRPSWLISGEIGKSAVDNAKMHLDDNLNFLMLDIRNFYPNCKREYVYQFFYKKLGVTKDVADILTDLTTYEMTIPTGCPTSQLIAFYAYEDMFLELARAAHSKDITFTLFVDDMTFSGKNPKDISALKNRVDIILRKYGHKPKYKKTKKYTPNDYKSVTGTVISPNKKLKIPNKQRHEISLLFQQLKKNVSEDQNVKLARKINGKISAARQIEKNYGHQMYRYCNQIIQFDLIKDKYNVLITTQKDYQKELKIIKKKVKILIKDIDNFPINYQIKLNQLHYKINLLGYKQST